VFGCLAGSKAVVELEPADKFRTDEPIRCAGEVVAYVAVYDASAGDYEQEVEVPAVRVADLRSGGRLIDFDVDYQDEADHVHALVLRATGGVAWITRAKVQRASPKDRRRGTFHWRVLDTAPGLAVRSLRLRGITLSWVRDGRRKRANLR